MDTYEFTKKIQMLHILEEVTIQSGFSNLVDIIATDASTHMHFNSILTNNDRMSLSNIVTNFDDNYHSQVANYIWRPMLSNPKVVACPYWTPVCSWEYRGSLNENIMRLHIYSMLTATDDDCHYDLRLYDMTNRTIIWEAEYANNVLNLDIDISDKEFPSTPASLEIQAKTCDGDEVIKIISIFVLMS